GAIIVVEYADRLISEEKMPHKLAYLEASKRMFWPVITSISTIVVVFLPLLFWPGVVGEFMKYMPITLLCVLTASILMALIFIPSIAISLKTITSLHQNIHDSTLEKIYLKVLTFVLKFPKIIIVFAIGILFFVKTIHGFLNQGTVFFPTIEPNKAVFYIHSRGDLSLKEQNDLVKEAESRILQMEELKSVTTSVNGSNNSNSKDVIGSITVEFIDWKLRKKASHIIHDMLLKMEDIKGVYIDSQGERAGPSNGKPISLEISGKNSSTVEYVVKRIEAFMRSQQGILSIETSMPLPSIEWKFVIDKQKVAKLGVNMQEISAALNLLTTGTTLTSYRPDDSKDIVDIVIRFNAENRSLQSFNKLTISTQQGLVPLSTFVDYKAQRRVNQIDRVDGKRVITLYADVAQGHFAEKEQSKIDAWLKAQDFFDSISYQFKGEDEDRKETGVFLLKAFGAAIFLVFLILLTQFNSFFKAFLVLSAVVMSTIGVFVGLIIHNMPFGIVMGGIGIIALAGIIVSNNIILIDTFDHKMGTLLLSFKTPTLEQIKDVIIKTCLERLRPVILTKLTAVLGLLPILFRMEIDFLTFNVHFGGPGTEWWILLAVCIVYGILFASSLTLLVTPCALWLYMKKTYIPDFKLLDIKFLKRLIQVYRYKI
ncbi:MAG: efflux RND transporter permease subunit, partial [Proteobacteria bacterium]|nr:efflux RND transporter permease subunit [Pseudomonadota bacterium]